MKQNTTPRFYLESKAGFFYENDDKKWYDPNKIEFNPTLSSKEYWEQFIKNHEGEEMFEDVEIVEYVEYIEEANS